ncbi:hypothetical protein LCGC14_1847390 [marine sediment metagenome]|uniref:Uncharacterized protein n=1 Tax=marine sediment metagenome TaxID=412755 RepID=A0A0F9GBB6_9ZZZZ
MNQEPPAPPSPPTRHKLNERTWGRQPEADAWLQRLGNKCANRVGDAIKRQARKAGRKCGFIVFVFDFGENGYMGYAADGRREDCIAALQEWIALQEGRLHQDPPTDQ